MKRVYCIAVTFNPAIEEFMGFVKSISPQLDKIIIIDNNSSCQRTLKEKTNQEKKINFIGNKENYGIAKAQNQGIEIAIKEDATHVIFFDQDSKISPDFIRHLIEEEERLINQGINLGAIGPKIIDESSKNSIPLINYKYGIKKRIHLKSNNDTQECFSLLSSGTLIRTKIIQEIGGYKDDLFIEYVDVEWGARARSKGYKIYGTSKASILHNLGENRINFLSITVPLHSPLRHYYTIRNGVYMQKQHHIPYYWKINDFIRLLRSFILFSLCNPPRKEQLKMMTLGMIHGIKGKMGKYKNG